jgi:Major tropism determinant N-terminal domain
LSEQLQLRRGAASQVAAFTGAQGEAVVDTTNNRLVVQDGATVGGFAAAKLSEVITNARTAISDAAYAVQTTDRLVAYSALTAARAVTLPAAAAYPTGTALRIVDESGNCSAANTLTIGRAGADTIEGQTSATIATAYGFIELESNGSNQWTLLAQNAPGASATVVQGPSGSSIKYAILEQLLTLSGSSTTSTIQIPTGAVVFAVGSRTVTAVTGAPSYGVGVTGNTTQFGGSLGVSAGSSNIGVIGPTAYYSPTNIVVTATSGSFTAGQVRIAIQYALLTPPQS